jgi:hypothetical protein
MSSIEVVPYTNKEDLLPGDSSYEISVNEVRGLLCGERVMVLPRNAFNGAIFIKAESAVFDMKESGGKRVSGAPFLTLELTEVETRALLHAVEVGLTASRKGDLHKSLPVLGAKIYPGGSTEVSAVRRVTKKMRAMFADGFWYKVTAEEAGAIPKDGEK